jgi:hypothetical protein
MLVGGTLDVHPVDVRAAGDAWVPSPRHSCHDQNNSGSAEIYLGFEIDTDTDAADDDAEQVRGAEGDARARAPHEPGCK